MRSMWRSIVRSWRAETWLLSSVLAIAGLLLVFGLIASEVMTGEPSAFDRSIILAFRNASDPSIPIGPPQLQEVARDITALGSHMVIGFVAVAAVAYLLLARMPATAGLVLIAVAGGAALNSLLKLGFGRPRPELVAPAVRVYTASFPSGHAALSAIAYLTLGALLARANPTRAMRIYFISIGVLLTVIGRHQPGLSRRALSHRCARRLVHRCGLGTGMLGRHDALGTRRSGESFRPAVIERKTASTGETLWSLPALTCRPNGFPA